MNPSFLNRAAACAAGFLLFASPFFAQKTALKQPPMRIKNGCGYAFGAKKGPIDVEKATDEARQIVAEICQKLGAVQNFEMLASDSVSNAQASVDGGKKFLIYSPRFLAEQKANSLTKWAVISVFAHEIGHLLNGDDFENEQPRYRKNCEKRADSLSGIALARVCCRRMDATAGLRTIDWRRPLGVYPDSATRVEKLMEAFDAERKKVKCEGQTTERPEKTSEKIGGIDAVGPINYVTLSEACKNDRDMLLNQPSAQIDDEKIVVTLAQNNLRMAATYKICIFSSDAHVQPTSIKIEGAAANGLLPRAKLPTRIIWNYKMDEASRTEASRGAAICVVVYDASRQPRPVTTGQKIGRAALGIGAVGLAAGSVLLGLRSSNVYSAYKKDFDRDTRDARLDKATRLGLTAQGLGAAAIAASAACFFASKKLKKRQKAEPFICQKPRPNLEPMVAENGLAMSAGLRLRF